MLSIHGDHYGYLEGKNAEEMRVILENKFGKVNQESRLEKIIKFFNWKKNDDNFISYFSKKRTMFSDIKAGMKPEEILPEEFLVAQLLSLITDSLMELITCYKEEYNKDNVMLLYLFVLKRER